MIDSGLVMASEDSTFLPWLSSREESHPEQGSDGFSYGHVWLQEHSQARTQLQATWENHDVENILPNKVNWPEKGCVLSEGFQEAIQTCTWIFFYVSAAAWVFWETLWEVTAGIWLLCFKSASIIAAPTEIKRKQHHYLAGCPVWLQQGFWLF